MPRRERDREIARRRKRKKESRKLRAKGRPGQSAGPMKGTAKKKPGKSVLQAEPKETHEPSTPEA